MNEDLRLWTVKQFEKLDFKSNADLQQVVLFAAKLCNTPFSSVSLIDHDTQWIKVTKGLDLEKIPRELSFCTHTIKRNRLMVVGDAQTDARFQHHPLTKSALGVRFYAGVPLVSTDGYNIGTLCVIDSKAHVLTAQQKMMLKILARHATGVMELMLSTQRLNKSHIDLKQVRENKTYNEVKLRSMFKSLTDCYFLLGKSGEITDFNQAACDFVEDKFDVKLSYGCIMTDFLNEAYQNIFTFYYRNALVGQIGRLERQGDYGEKGKIWWDCVFTPVRDDTGMIIGVSYVARDINERKLHEEKIIQQNRLLSKIAEIQSHDYRGPVASILGLMNLIEEDGYVASKEYLMMMQSAVEMLDEKIHEVVSIVNHSRVADSPVD